ncbi:glycosyltransferase family 4 protein [Vibrio crassostreae]|uniref:glycosyltransferase family 4 protein n=1 Tax=Vibrio crassostreae TaxID=246167 RepID=UPI00104B0B06|nr:glycosyltransferase family 4 protein [Vibrio crassostreae]TCN92832.1 glycosyltransferase involved in cell wall biosynthesis [Vibrio crassostreae]CAK1934932.1 Glycosyltransferase involved in cell wall biosynthesis [Vibrio crassostreae]CAK1943279.1 Glycosyltransferase involved in cell wall biosynthesis [Vibrio crassostreae]CAK1948370.1 Glycosyltransferase involved in cell wall biosynthesis [Vibrio crassostreae]CAK2709247.1 Glycosyltransferase involved in cell wall biosynthesis [Vibrio crassos
MRICHVNLASGFSGGERQTLQLITQQLKEGYQLTVVVNPKSPLVDEVKKLSCSVILTTHFTKAHTRDITDGCIAIHVHEGRAIYWALIQSKLFGIPYIVTRRIDNPLKQKFLSKLAYSNASALIGLSNEIVERIKVHYPRQKIYKIPSSPVHYPVNPKLVQKIQERFDGKFVVIQAANLLHHKGHETTLAAARDLRLSHPKIQFVLLGDGTERQKLESLAKESALSNVTFAGKQSNMGDWFAAADLLIHPSYSEGLGSVILEGINAGLPAVGTKAGGIPDIIEDKVSGLLVEPRNGKALASAILSLFENKELRESLIKGGKHKMKDFDITYTSSLYREIYNSMQ